MSNKELEGLSKADIKSKLVNMGMSLDRTDHPKEYYVNLYLEKSQAKNKVTRDNTTFYNPQFINEKRIRPTEENIYDSYNSEEKYDDPNDEDYIEEENEENSEKRNLKKNESTKKKDDYENSDYRESGIKITRLIRQKKKKHLFKTTKERVNLSKPRDININLNENGNYEMAGQEYENEEKNRYVHNDDNNDEIKQNENDKLNSATYQNLKVQNNENNNENENNYQNNNYVNRKKSNNSNNSKPNTYDVFLHNITESVKRDDNNNNQNYNYHSANQVNNYQNYDDQGRGGQYDNNQNIITVQPMYAENLQANNLNDYIHNTVIRNKKNENIYNSDISSEGTYNFGINRKNIFISKFINNVFFLPLLLLLIFGIIYFLNQKDENFESTNLIICFSIVMGLLFLYHLFKYVKKMKKYKKMAKLDYEALKQILNNMNITRENLANQTILLNHFVTVRIQFHNITPEEYINYVFPYLKRYLEKDYLLLDKEELKENERGNNKIYWKEI